MTTAVRPDAALGVAASPTAAPALRLSQLTKTFAVRRSVREMLRHPRSGQRVTAVDAVSCDVAAGELFGLLGPNGAGKTTLLKMLATLVLPDSGTAAIHGLDVVRDADEVRRIVTPVVADERTLNWRLTARENLELFAVLLEVPRRERRARIDALLSDVGLADAGSKLVNAFSSGMRQRLLIARALLARPKVLMLDEPTRSLDPVTAHAFRAFLRTEIVGRRGCTILLATHSAEEAFELCDRVAVLHRGRVLAQGPAHALARQVGEERYRAWTTAPTAAAFAELVARGLARRCTVREEREGDWQCVELESSSGGGDADAAAAMLAFLAEHGVPVSRFERHDISLAELIERVVAAGSP